jgi:hypothetical protein
MEQNTPTQPPAPVQLKALALELGVPVEEVERELTPRNIFRSAAGFQSCTSFSANRLIEKYAARKAEAEARQAATAERVRKFTAAKHAEIPKGFTKFGLATTVINPNGDETPAVVKMTAAAPAPDYEGSTMTRRPSSVDWIAGDAEGGQAIGPSRKQMEEAAAARKQERLRAKQARKGGSK